MRKLERPTFAFDRNIDPLILGTLRSARKYVIFVSPYIRLWDELREEIEAARSRRITVAVLHRRGANRSDIAWLENAGVKVRAIRGLHAKLVVNEFSAIVSSMNLYDYSRKYAREAAVRFEAQRDVAEVLTYITEGLGNLSVRRPVANMTDYVPCVGCGAMRLRVPERPFCLDCYDRWQPRTGNRDKNRHGVVAA